MLGRTHSVESKAKISDSMTGTNNPMFGKVAANAIAVSVYSLDNVLVQTFIFPEEVPGCS